MGHSAADEALLQVLSTNFIMFTSLLAFVPLVDSVLMLVKRISVAAKSARNQDSFTIEM